MAILTRNPNLDVQHHEAGCNFRELISEKDDPDLYGHRPEWWWTGKKPKFGECPGYFDNTWTLTEVLFSALQGAEAFYLPPYHQLRHPLIFYYCHPAVFYINKMRVAKVIEAPLDPFFEQLFETGVDEMSWDDMSKNEMDWPPVRQVTEYRRQAYRIVKSVILTHPGFKEPINWDNPVWSLFMGFEHERIHLETSSVLMRELPLHLLRQPPAFPRMLATKSNPSLVPQRGADFPENPLIPVAAKTVSLGKQWDFPSYGWDNEYGSRYDRVRPFRASKCKITNGEFYEFVTAGGYRNESVWSPEGWKWRQFRNVKWPTFWAACGPQGANQFNVRTMFEMVEMHWDWPVIVNYYEAEAFCNWKSAEDGLPEGGPKYRLLTEAEHHVVRGNMGDNYDPVMAYDGVSLVTAGNVNANFGYGSEISVLHYAANEMGFHDVFGNVWEWCEDDFAPFPDFRAHPLYDDFSTPCFDGRHHVILGGSFISTGAVASRFGRYEFRAHFFQHAGFRLALADDGDRVCDAVKLNKHQEIDFVRYQTETQVNEFMLLHYGSEVDSMPYAFGPVNALHFHCRTTGKLCQWAQYLSVRMEKALDIGCSVGRATFELARTFDNVLGVDISEAALAAAQKLKENGELAYFRKDEGDLGKRVLARIDADIDRIRVQFRHVDACTIPLDIFGFDAVHMTNVLDRMANPKACLAKMGGPRGLVKPGGILLLTSPYTWLPQFTPKCAWVGGYERDGHEVTSVGGLKEVLGAEFELLYQEDTPLLIREHKRKFQYIITHLTIWRRQFASGA